jgi:hypothetical protein
MDALDLKGVALITLRIKPRDQCRIRRATSPRHGRQLWSVDRESLEDRAIIATDGSLESDSAAFRRPDQGHRTSPWFRLPLKLHSVESARARYNTWAASEWDRNHDGPPTYVLRGNGQKRELPRRKTPYATKALVKA